MGGRFEGLQYARGIAACLVVLFHALVNSKQPGLGECGVDLFFVLSGFLMWRVGRNDSTYGFMSKRVLRVVPLYWTATLVVYFAAVVGLTGRIQADPVYLLLSLAFLPYSSPVGVYPLLNVGWTLNYEVFFYLAFAATIGLRRQAVILTGLLTTLAMLHPLAAGVATSFYTDPIILEFAMGVWLGVLYERVPANAVVGSLLVAAGAWLLLQPLQDFRFISWGLPAAGIIAGILMIERAGALPRVPGLRVLGDASFSVYLWHPFAIAALQAGQPGVTPLFAAGMLFGLTAYFLIEKPVTWRIGQLRQLRLAFR